MGSNASPVLTTNNCQMFFGVELASVLFKWLFAFLGEKSHKIFIQLVSRSTTNGGGPVETSGVGGSRSQQISTTMNNGKPGDQPEKSSQYEPLSQYERLSQYEKTSQYERLATEKKKPEVKAKPKLPKVIPVVKSVSEHFIRYKYSLD